MAAAAGLAAVLCGAGGAAAQGRIPCGGDLYTVQPGDALSAIAQRAYSSFNYQVIFDANQDTLTSPSVLRVGQQLFIPCLDGGGAAVRAEPAALPEGAPAGAETGPVGGEVAPDRAVEDEAPVVLASASARQPMPALDRPVLFLTGSDAGRFTHRDLPEGGMIAEMINRAMQRADALRPYRISWENDWDRHLDELLPGGVHDVSFPWFRPDCARAERLSEALRARCERFDFSDPLYAVEIGYYVEAGDRAQGAAAHSALSGRRLCRPEELFRFDLEAAGLVEPEVTLLRPATAGNCFEMLAAGEVEVVSLDTATAEREIAERRLRSRVAEVPALATTETLHAVSARSNPFGRAYLQLIDTGVAQLRAEGVWSEVTERHLAEYARRR